ncbi:swr complex subunit [Ophidiomyces ophidiicola]|nr:swr complex subunit [Ophidiomyces ophidiicola]KAI1950200.1 swr complex subunit [Ophidiomyces ophidiicola]KAI1965693.1 swr complex subunit [Ophidiomyces ophidiicola]KAI2017735.1 swr complex subunit [Ophidiomyces ophidiicola]KAI2039715.1 swr complex subunit [Ophidiomyces ophidiicola]
MAAADIRDMLDLPQESQPRPAKKQKVGETKRPDGYSRELYALLGDKAPPIALTENKYKGRKKWASKLKVRPWDITPFTNPARSDELVLHHWQRKVPPKNLEPSGETAESNGTAGETSQPEAKADNDDYAFAKYNIKPQIPRRYTDEEYDCHLQSEIWSREETDYLMDLATEFDLRWIVIADRYEFQPKTTEPEGNASALVVPTQTRTMEDMKARYYTVAGKMLAIEHPLSEMSQPEFSLYETMMKFNAEREKQRKELATVQFNRSKDEVQEEALLLEELKRIVASEQSFIEERKELYSRLDAPVSTGNTTVYQSSHGLAQLLQSLLQADKNKKRRSLLGPDQAPSPGGQAGGQSSSQSARESRPETPAVTAPLSTKKGAAAAQQPSIRTLTPLEEAKYGVSHHDRLSSGVQFRNDKAQKLTQAKSNIQSQKISAALTELDIPPRLFMPTEKVCKEFEKLIQSVNVLLDVRKYAEKVEAEIRVLEAAKEERERKEREKDGTLTGEGVETSTAEGGEPVEPNSEAGKESVTVVEAPSRSPATKAPAASFHKRSASVLSAISEKGTKKQKK